MSGTDPRFTDAELQRLVDRLESVVDMKLSSVTGRIARTEAQLESMGRSLTIKPPSDEQKRQFWILAVTDYGRSLNDPAKAVEAANAVLDAFEARFEPKPKETPP